MELRVAGLDDKVQRHQIEQKLIDRVGCSV